MSSIDFYEVIRHTATIILQGKIILYPTDTVWGIGCDATNEKSIQRVFEIKHRPKNKSVILLVASIEQLQQYVTLTPFITDFLHQQTKPTTVVYPTTKIPLAQSVYAQDGSVAIRVVNHSFCNTLIEKIQIPLVSTSANIYSESTPQQFKEISTPIKTGVDYIIPSHFEQSTQAQPSQIVRFKDNGQIEWIRR